MKIVKVEPIVNKKLNPRDSESQIENKPPAPEK